jgi:hypothetical protein
MDLLKINVTKSDLESFRDLLVLFEAFLSFDSRTKTTENLDTALMDIENVRALDEPLLLGLFSLRVAGVSEGIVLLNEDLYDGYDIISRLDIAGDFSEFTATTEFDSARIARAVKASERLRAVLALASPGTPDEFMQVTQPSPKGDLLN